MHVYTYEWLCGEAISEPTGHIQVIRRQISYRIIKQVAHFQMSYVNTADGVVSIKKIQYSVYRVPHDFN